MENLIVVWGLLHRVSGRICVSFCHILGNLWGLVLYLFRVRRSRTTTWGGTLLLVNIVTILVLTITRIAAKNAFLDNVMLSARGGVLENIFVIIFFGFIYNVYHWACRVKSTLSDKIYIYCEILSILPICQVLRQWLSFTDQRKKPLHFWPFYDGGHYVKSPSSW